MVLSPQKKEAGRLDGIQRGDEPAYSLEGVLRPVPLRRVSAVGKKQDAHRAPGGGPDRLDLPGRAVGVVFALEGQDGTAHGGKALLDVPAAELRAEPDARPGLEGPIGVLALGALPPAPEVRRAVALGHLA